MYFKDRPEAGRLLARALKKYKGKDVIVYALPRGGVVTALEIARYLHAPLDLIIARKIGHPYSPEYAIAAIAENGHIVSERGELASVDEKWLTEAIERERQEVTRRRKKYLKKIKEISAKGKIAILVDDGVATGLTLRVGIVELIHRHPKKIVVAVPVIQKSTANIIKAEADELVTLQRPSDDKFLGAVGAYYVHFPQVTDDEVISILQSYDEERKNVFTVDVTNGRDLFNYDEP